MSFFLLRNLVSLQTHNKVKRQLAQLLKKHAQFQTGLDASHLSQSSVQHDVRPRNNQVFGVESPTKDVYFHFQSLANERFLVVKRKVSNYYILSEISRLGRMLIIFEEEVTEISGFRC